MDGNRWRAPFTMEFPPDTVCWLCTLLEIDYWYQPAEKSTPWRRDVGTTLPHSWANLMISLLEGTWRLVPQHMSEICQGVHTLDWPSHSLGGPGTVYRPGYAVVTAV